LRPTKSEIKGCDSNFDFFFQILKVATIKSYISFALKNMYLDSA